MIAALQAIGGYLAFLVIVGALTMWSLRRDVLATRADVPSRWAQVERAGSGVRAGRGRK